MKAYRLLSTAFFILCVGCSSTPIRSTQFCDHSIRSPTAQNFQDAPPVPIITVQGNFFYSDENNSIINDDLYKKNADARKPLRDFLDKVLKATDAAILGDATAALMVNRWLLSWAEGDALTKVDSQQGGFERKWILSGLILTYLRNRPHSNWIGAKKIEKWLNQLTHLMMEDYQEYKKGSQKNNHVYWAGLVAIEMAAVNSDKNLLNWGLEKIRYGIAQIDESGFLPLELERKGKALQYHRVSIEALIMAAFFAKIQGVDLLSENNSALNRLALKTTEGFENPEIFATKAGIKQDFKLKESTAWLLVYDQLRPGNPAVERILKSNPPAWSRILGGNLLNTLLQTGGRIQCRGLF